MRVGWQVLEVLQYSDKEEFTEQQFVRISEQIHLDVMKKHQKERDEN